MEEREDELPDTYEMCCGRAKCPVISREGDGIVIKEVLDGAEFEARISLSIEQARELKKWLDQKGF